MLCIMTDQMSANPNPQDWTDTSGAAEILGATRATVYDYVNKGTLTRHKAGTTSIFWVPEVREVRDALDRLRRR